MDRGDAGGGSTWTTRAATGFGYDCLELMAIRIDPNTATHDAEHMEE